MNGASACAQKLIELLHPENIDDCLYLAVDHYVIEGKLKPVKERLKSSFGFLKGGHNSLEIIAVFLNAGANKRAIIHDGKTSLSRSIEKGGVVAEFLSKDPQHGGA